VFAFHYPIKLRVYFLLRNNYAATFFFLYDDPFLVLYTEQSENVLKTCSLSPERIEIRPEVSEILPFCYAFVWNTV
jgi:hypothetical protein